MGKSLFLNPHLLFLMVAHTAKYVIRFVPMAAAVYYFQYVAGNMGVMPRYILFKHGIGAFIGAFISSFLGKKFGSRNTVLVTFALVPAIFLVIGFLVLLFEYKLTREKIVQYQAEIDARQSS